MTGWLADTHVILWALSRDPRLSVRQAKAPAGPDPVFVSIASLWEVAIKTSIGKLKLAQDLNAEIAERDARLLGIDKAHVDEVATLPLHHRDPFDRMLIAQARVEGLRLLTSDRRFAAYGIETG